MAVSQIVARSRISCVTSGNWLDFASVRRKSLPMAKLATITQLSPTMTEGVFVEWMKNVGDSVKPGDVIAAIETDKAVMDLEAFETGILLKQLAAKGDKLPVGAAIAVIGQTGEDYAGLLAAAAKPGAVATPVKEAAAPAVGNTPIAAGNLNAGSPETKGAALNDTPPVQHAETRSRIKASPLAKKLAHQNGVDLATLTGSGPQGRIVSRDLQNAGPAPAGTRISDSKIALTPMRKTIADRLALSKQTVPHFYLTRTVNLTRLVELRAEMNQGLAKLHESATDTLAPKKVSINDFFIAAAAQALSRHAPLRRQFAGDHFIQLGNVDVGFAVSLDDGLITPVIRNADQLTLFEIANAASALASRARARKLKPEEYTGGTFTISNLGMLGITSFQAIINAPEAAILAVGASERRAIESPGGGVAFGDYLSLNLACDHRVVDGAAGAAFLADLALYLENPGLIR